MSRLKQLDNESQQYKEIELTSHKTSQAPTVISGKDQVQFFFDHRREIESLLACTFKNQTTIEIKAKPEAFGLVRWGASTIYVYPKFLCLENKPVFDLMTALFFVVDGNRPEIFLDINANQNRDDFSNFFDFYFFNILSQVKKFLRLYTRVDFLSETQEIDGIKGRIKLEETVRRFGGLSHKSVCEIGIVERNNLLFGLLKNMTRKIINLSKSDLNHSLGAKILSELSSFKDIDATKENLEKLDNTSAKIKRESKRTKALYKSLLQTLLFVTDRSNIFSTVTFSFNMNRQYEFLVREFLEQSMGGLINIKSGNDCAEPLLHCDTKTILVDNEFDEMTVANGVVKIKPDLIISEGVTVTCVADTKYKLLSILKGKSGIKIAGVKSADVQQILTYWLHHTEKNGMSPKVKLIYPMPDHKKYSDAIVENLGSILLTLNGLKMKQYNNVAIEVIGVSIPKLLKLMVDKDKFRSELSSTAIKLIA